jgi:hypothetical protein
MKIQYFNNDIPYQMDGNFKMKIYNILVELSSILVLLCVTIGITINTPIFKYVYPKFMIHVWVKNMIWLPPCGHFHDEYYNRYFSKCGAFNFGFHFKGSKVII